MYLQKMINDVKSGKAIVNEHIKKELDRIEGLFNNPTIFFDEDACNGFFEFCENEMVLSNGGDLVLLDSFKLWAEALLGFFTFERKSVYNPDKRIYEVRDVKKRLVNKQFLIVARGAAKSMYASLIQAYFLLVDKESTKSIVVAPTIRQADEILDTIRLALTKARGPYLQFLVEGKPNAANGNFVLQKKAASTKKGIENFLNGSIVEARPMKIDKLQGLRPKVATIDEWLSCDVREDVIGAIEQGSSKLDDYIILGTSSEGTVRNGAGDSIKMELLDILNGNVIDPTTSIWYYRLDDLQEIYNPSAWIKANPNLGITVPYEIIERDVAKIKNSPTNRNDILAKRFGIPMEGYTYFFSYQETLPTGKHLNFDGMECSLGIDLSQGDDFCSFTLLFPLRDGGFGIKTLNFVTQHYMRNSSTDIVVKYDEFVKEGTLMVMEGTVLDMVEVYEEVEIFLQRYEVVSVGYDPYNADYFIERYKKENSPYGVHVVRQGARTESVPLGELKNLASDGKLIFDSSLFSFCMGNAISLEDNNGNRKLAKIRHSSKIDAVAAMLDAFVAYKRERMSF